jgi:long-chain acyl-CoA synthetase
MSKKLRTPWLKFYGFRKKSLKYPDLSMYDMIERSARNYPSNLAMEYFGNRINYENLMSQIDAAARGLKALGIGPGDVVSVCSANIPEAVVAIYAINKIGAIINVFHPLSAPNEIKYFLNLTASKTLLMIDIAWPAVKPILADTEVKNVVVLSPTTALPFMPKAGLKIASLIPLLQKKQERPSGDNVMLWQELLACGAHFYGDVNAHSKSKAIAAIIYSGGTTGSPKGVALNNLSFNAMAMQVAEFFPSYAVPGNKILGIMPIFHGFGLGVGFHAMFVNGMANIMYPKFDVKKFDRILKQSKPDLLVGVPTLYEAMLRNRRIRKLDLSHVKIAISGGDMLSDPLKHEIDKLLKRTGSSAKLIQGYGMAECLSVSCVTPDERYKPGTIGIPVANVFYKIVEPQTYTEKPYGELGEIVLTGPNLMDGYVNNDKETNETLQVHADGRVWLHTGDIGYMDEEGYVFFKQRLKRIIVSSGYNIYPSQVEDVICQVPEVLMATVVGLPDEYRGQIAKAFIVLKDGVKQSKAVLEGKILTHCRQNLAKFEMPRSLEFRKSLPKTKIGKVAYNELINDQSAKD